MDVSNLKNQIISQIDSKEILNYYLRPFHNKSILNKGQHISNPFLSQKQKTPSFNIYKNDNNEWRYKDFATDDEGSYFDLVMKLFNCEFKDAVLKIANDFNVDINQSQNKRLNIQKGIWDAKNMAYWTQFGITQNVLEKYDVFPILEYQTQSNSNQCLNIKSHESDPIYAYQIHNQCFKIYKPLSTNYKFSWLGNKSKNYIFGFNQLNNKADRVFITGGEKDVLSLISKHEQAICFNSETFNPSKELIDELK